jgi:hypothetical protein
MDGMDGMDGMDHFHPAGCALYRGARHSMGMDATGEIIKTAFKELLKNREITLLNSSSFEILDPSPSDRE